MDIMEKRSLYFTIAIQAKHMAVLLQMAGCPVDEVKRIEAGALDVVSEINELLERK